jgi:hypothetical protein
VRALVLTLTAAAVLVVSGVSAARALRAPAPPRTTVHAASEPLFDLRGLQPGDRAARCISVATDTPRELSVFGGGENSALAPHVRVQIFRGCDGNEVLFDGRLDRLPVEEDAVADPVRTAGREYRVEVSVVDGAPQATRTKASFGFGATGGPSARAASCAGLGGRQKVVRHARISRRVTATLILRAFARGRIALTTGVRVRGKTLALRRWATVGYAVNGRGAQRLRTRPFRLRTNAGALTPGHNVIVATLEPRRGRSVRARFALDLSSRCEAR